MFQLLKGWTSEVMRSIAVNGANVKLKYVYFRLKMETELPTLSSNLWDVHWQIVIKINQLIIRLLGVNHRIPCFCLKTSSWYLVKIVI